MANMILMPADELLMLIRSAMSDELTPLKNQIPQANSEKLLSIEETAKFFHVSKVTIHKWKKKKLIQPYRMGRMVYFKERELFDSLSQKNFKKQSL